jgi:hypothetical protein
VEPQQSWGALTLKGVGVSSRGKMDEFYDRMHSYLRSCNVDGVKVDVQAAATMLGAGRGGSAVATREMVQAMERSVSKTFGREQCINCMCHPIECLYAYQDTCVARASDDFYPNDAASHTLHVANVAYNSLFLGEIVFPDWDMFQSNNSVATLHAVARAVGGCSVYISDHPGEHDLKLLKRIVLPDGSDQWDDWFSWQEEGSDWRRRAKREAPEEAPEGFRYATCPRLETDEDYRKLVGRKVLVAHERKKNLEPNWYMGRIKLFGVSAAWKKTCPSANFIIKYSKTETGNALDGDSAIELATHNYGVDEWWLLLDPLLPEE